MCTAITFCPGDHYFGRNLDLEYSYNEVVTITPRNFPFQFRNGSHLPSHYALIGMATVAEGYPLYYEATNEKGLSLAGLNFPGNAQYFPARQDKENIAPFELIPWLLGSCATVAEAKACLDDINLWNCPFSETFPLSPLHWLLADKDSALTIESTKENLKVYENPVGILTNNPPFPYHLHNLTNYMALTEQPPTNRQPIELRPYSLGLGSFGLPGDMSSGSRFVKAAFTKMHSVCGQSEISSVSQFFHILGSACQQRGLTQLENGKYEFTLYTSCCNSSKGIYYYTTYENSRISAVDMHREDLNKSDLITFPLVTHSQILFQNR